MINKYQNYLISIGIILILFAFLFHKPLTGEYVFVGPDTLSPSAINQGINYAEEKYDKYPLWIPWLFSGLPSVHSFQNISDYYFPNIIINIIKFLGLPGFWNYIFHFIITCFGVILILRILNISWFGSIYSGLSFGLMPYLITMVVHGHGSQMMSVAWMPWFIWAMVRLYRSVNLINVGILSIIVGLQLQRAHVQIAYYSWLIAGILIVILFFNTDKLFKEKIKWLYSTCIALFLGFCMSMWIYMPALNYVNHSIRSSKAGGAGLEYATAWSFSFNEIATFFIPSFYGFGGITYWGEMPFTDYPNYMGIIVLCFAIIGALLEKNRLKYFFIFIFILALLTSFGDNFFLYQIFYNYLPFFNKFRVPVMILIVAQFSISILAGFGFDIVIKTIRNRTFNEVIRYQLWIVCIVLMLILFFKLIFGNGPDFGQRSHPVLDAYRLDMMNFDIIKSIGFIFLGVFLFYIYWRGWIKNKLLMISIILLSLIDILLIDWKIIYPSKDSFRQSTIAPISMKNEYLSRDEVINFLKSDTTRFRILPDRNLWNENRWAAFQIESVMGYHPAKISAYNTMVEKVGWNSIGLLKMLNVKYIISLGDLSHPLFKKVFSGNLYYRGEYKMANVYQFTETLPRLYYAENIKIISNQIDQFDFFNNNKFDPRIVSIVDREIDSIQYDFNSYAEIINWSPDKIEIDASTNSNQLLILSEIYYPDGWRLTSHPGWDIIKVNNILRGIIIPKGEHHIIMEFTPADIFYGSVITWSSSIVILIIILIGNFIKYTKNE